MASGAVAAGSVGDGMSDRRVELEVARQQDEPVHQHRDPDRHHEQPAHERHQAAVADERAQQAGRPVVERPRWRGTGCRARACSATSRIAPWTAGSRSRRASACRRGGRRCRASNRSRRSRRARRRDPPVAPADDPAAESVAERVGGPPAGDRAPSCRSCPRARPRRRRPVAATCARAPGCAGCRPDSARAR